MGAVFMLIVALVLVAIFAGIHNGKLFDQYRAGQVTLQQYCDEVTDYGTDTNQIPVICYQVYNVKSQGQECQDVIVGKMIAKQCHPRLIPN